MYSWHQHSGKLWRREGGKREGEERKGEGEEGKGGGRGRGGSGRERKGGDVQLPVGKCVSITI